MIRSSCGEGAATDDVGTLGLQISRGEAVGCMWASVYTTAADRATRGPEPSRPHPTAPALRSSFRAVLRGGGTALPEDAPEENGDGAQVAAGVEARLDPLAAQGGDDILLLEHHLAEGPLSRPDAHRGALDGLVGVLARAAPLGKRQ